MGILEEQAKEIIALKERIAWLENENENLEGRLHESVRILMRIGKDARMNYQALVSIRDKLIALTSTEEV